MRLATSVAVAVSGGADSMALLLMTDKWAKQRGKRAIALTVDHGLRPESADEARQVARWCETRGIEHHILNIPSPSQGEGQGGGCDFEDNPHLNPPPKRERKIIASQADAREARYRLLTGWCKAHGAQHLLTAHHRGDQAETLFFRLARGSGIMGLACILPVSQLHGVQLIRPLLSFSKAALETYLKEQGQPWIEDPSNHNPKYTRTLIRKHLQSLPDADAIEARAAKLAGDFARIRAVMERKIAEATAQVVRREPDGGTALDTAALRRQPPEIARLLLSRTVQHLSGEEHPPRSEKIARLYRALNNHESNRATLAHLLFTWRPESDCFSITRRRAAP